MQSPGASRWSRRSRFRRCRCLAYHLRFGGYSATNRRYGYNLVPEQAHDAAHARVERASGESRAGIALMDTLLDFGAAIDGAGEGALPRRPSWARNRDNTRSTAPSARRDRAS